MVRNEIDTNDVIKRYQAGESMDKIAKSFGTSRPPIDRILRGAGVIIRGRNDIHLECCIDPIFHFDIIRRYQAGESSNDIGTGFGKSRRTIIPILKRAGIVIRDGHNSMLARMARTTPEERIRLAGAAHAAVRGKRRTEKELLQRAATKEGDLRWASRVEIVCKSMLEERGFSCIAQKAIGSYNIDVAITEPPIAVEIFGGGWHCFGTHRARHRKRFDYILNAGWSTVIIWVDRDFPLEIGAIEYIVALVEKIRSGKSPIGQEHVIRGDGHLSSRGKTYLNHRTVVPDTEP